MTVSKHQIHDEHGNPVGFDQLYDTWFEPIFHYILHRVGNVAEAEDLTSQTFFKALRNLWRYRWTGVGFSAWLYRIATNEVNSFFRARKPELDLQEGPEPTAEEQADDELARAEREWARNRLLRELIAAIHTLKADEQTLITLRYLEQKPFPEIAEIMNKRQGSLIMRTHRALEKLEHELQRRGIDHERFREGFEPSGHQGYPGPGIQARFAP